MANEFVIKNGFISNDDSMVSGRFTATTISATTYLNLPSFSGGSVSGDYLPLSGGTVTGETVFTNGLITNTISATTYLNLPVSNFTGGTVSGNTIFTSGLTANTISASSLTINGISITGDTFLTGATLSRGTLTLNNNNDSPVTTVGEFLQYFISATTPTGLVNSGDRWFNTNTGVELVWINDGNSTQWVQPFSVPGPAPDQGYYSTTGVTSSQTITWDRTYWGISGSTNVDITLPTAVNKDGYYLVIKDESGNSGTNRIRLTPASGTIDGNNYVDMNIDYMSLTLIARNGDWYII
jgi:hypothetical protein